MVLPDTPEQQRIASGAKVSMVPAATGVVAGFPSVMLADIRV
ncbi:3-oxoacyl-ACP synthase [Nocardia seriolae]|nr:3-oxoacyl-ACP synthase [Nocardia seriolae]